MDITHKIESLLLVSAQEMSIAQLAKLLKVEKSDVEEALSVLCERFGGESGIVLLRSGDSVRFASNPAHADLLASYLHTEITGELTRPQLEVITIVAYRSPVSKSDIEMIRGMNCSLILRNLLMRGLITEEQTGLEPQYTLSLDTVRLLGITTTGELPEFEKLSSPDLLASLESAQTNELSV